MKKEFVNMVYYIDWFADIEEIELPYDPAIPLLGIHTEETRRAVHDQSPDGCMIIHVTCTW